MKRILRTYVISPYSFNDVDAIGITLAERLKKEISFDAIHSVNSKVTAMKVFFLTFKSVINENMFKVRNYNWHYR